MVTQSLNGTQNGNVDMQAQILAFLAQFEPRALQDKISARETAIQPMYDRMDGDYRLWNLTPFIGIDDPLYDSVEFLHATDNAPKTFYNKVSNWYIQAAPIFRIEMEGRDEQLRRIDSAKERLAYGLIDSADRLEKRRGHPSVRRQTAFQICVRGPVFARVLLRIDQRTGRTIVDINVWDARNVVWDSGPDGLNWIAFKMRKTRSQIKREYPGAQLDESTLTFNNNDQTGINVIDYYDDVVNAVFTEDLKILKAPEPHARPRMPVAYAFAGSAPLLSNDTTSDHIKDFSESIYETNREGYKNNNFLLSVGLHLAAQARDPAKLLFSAGGELTLSEDANAPGAEIPLDVNLRQDFKIVPPTELTNTAAQMQALFQSQIQQGSLSAVQFGNAPFSLSGFAINSLAVSAEEKIQPRIEQGNDFYFMALDLLMEQYATGMFPILTATGKDRSGSGFSEAIPPQVVQIGGELIVDFVANLPSDEMTKIQAAMLLRQPGVNGMPIVDDKWIRDNKLGIRDTDNMEDRLRGQLAERGSPMATIWSNIEAVRNQGDKALEFIYQQDLLFLQFQMWASTQGMIVPQLPQIGGPEFGSPAANRQQAAQGGPSATVPSNVSPPEAIGIQSQPGQQSGPNVPPGTQRPGAQNNPGQGVGV